MKWLTNLISQFEHQNVSDAKAEMLDTLFKDRLPEIMETAVIEYLKTGGDWFPTVRQMQAYVDAAQTEHDRGATVTRSFWQVQAMTQLERDSLDDKLYAAQFSDVPIHELNPVTSAYRSDEPTMADFKAYREYVTTRMAAASGREV